MDNSMVTKGALALWTAKNPESALKKIGFKGADEVELHMEDICLVVDLDSSTLNFGMVSKIGEELIEFKFYEEIGENEEVKLAIKVPKNEVMVLPLSNEPPTTKE